MLKQLMRLWALLIRLSVPDSSTDDSALDPRAGALGFRDFPGLPAAKENRNDSRQTLLTCSLRRSLTQSEGINVYGNQGNKINE